MLKPRPTVLGADPTHAQLQAAVAENHRSWMALNARMAGGEVRQDDGVTWVYTPLAGSDSAILFPRPSPDNAGAHLDAIVRYYRDRRPHHPVLCWSLEPAEPPDLAVRLVARGFEWGFIPHWMWLDLHRVALDQPERDGLRIEAVEDEADWDVDDLPYYSQDASAHLHALTRLQPRCVWHFAARLEGKVVGHCKLYVTRGALGVAGIFNAGVVPAARNRGIGAALTLAACRQALAVGCRHALLNATPMGEPVYRRLGFESIGYGQTWYLPAETLALPPPSELQVALAEAVGRGDIEALEVVAPRLEMGMLDAGLACGMTPIQLATKMEQPAAVDWLILHGATLDIISAWDLGRKELAAELLARSPSLANVRSGRGQVTPLHEAALRGDVELAQVVLAAAPDLEVQDLEFHSTPLGWAQHLGQTQIVELIEQHLARVKSE